MKIEEIQDRLSDARHEIWHAQEQLARQNYLGAWLAAGRAKEAISAADAALDKIQD